MTNEDDLYSAIHALGEDNDDAEDLIWKRMQAAIATFDKNKPEPLISLLMDDDSRIRRRGLHIFAWLGKSSIVALEAALESIDSQDPVARNNVMEGIICYPKSLDARQAMKILRRAVDSHVLVRGKVTVFLGAASVETIGAAIELIDEPERSDYKRAFMLFGDEPSQAQMMFDKAVTETSLESTFVLASIEKMARQQRLPEAPKYFGDGYIGRSVVANTERLLRRGQARG